MKSSNKGITTSRERRITELRSMSGTDFAVETAGDLLLLRQEERTKALKTLQAIDEAVTREAQQ